MSKPRHIEPGAVWHVTRRTADRRFFLLPTPIVQAILGFALGMAALLTGVQIHAFAFMTNHIHLVLTDVDGRLPEFMGWFLSRVSAALNLQHKRRTSGTPIFDNHPYSAFRLMDPEQIQDAIDYVIANPVDAHLVAQAQDWHGSLSLPHQLTKTLVFERPKVYFRSRGQGALDAKVKLHLHKPTAFAHLSDRAYASGVAKRLAKSERQAKRARGDRSVLGRARAQSQAPTSSPSSPHVHEPQRHTFLCTNKSSRDEYHAYERTFQALVRHNATLFNDPRTRSQAVFPRGTYLYPRRFRAPTTDTFLRPPDP